MTCNAFNASTWSKQASKEHGNRERERSESQIFTQRDAENSFSNCPLGKSNCLCCPVGPTVGNHGYRRTRKRDTSNDLFLAKRKKLAWHCEQTPRDTPGSRRYVEAG